jgi:hypothetical protein
MSRNVRNVMDEANMVAVDVHQHETVSSAAVTMNVPATATHVLYTISGAPVRMRLDGTAPDANTGLYLGIGASGMLRREAALAAKFIRATGSDGALDAQPMAY